MENGISTEEDYPFQGQKGDYCKPKTKVMCVYIYINVLVVSIYKALHFLLTFDF